MASFFSTVVDSAATSTYNTTWVTASASINAGDFVTVSNSTYTVTGTIQLGFQGFLQGVDYVHEKIKEIFDNRAKIKQYRKSLFTEKIRQTSRIIKKQAYTVMIPPKRNFRGQESQRK